VRDFQLPGETRLQFRAEVFNVSNHVNFGLPVADLNSPNFGRIFSAGSPRLMQFALRDVHHEFTGVAYVAQALGLPRARKADLKGLRYEWRACKSSGSLIQASPPAQPRVDPPG